MADAKDRPQILQHICKSLTTTVYDTLWVPSSARFVVLGSTARSTGSIQVYELSGSELSEVAKVEKPCSIKCGTFGASTLVERQVATGDFKGNLHIWDLEKLSTPVFHVKAHETIINAIDGCGGLGIGYGAPEIVTGGRDGCVCVWDQRQKDDPVASFEPETKDAARDCWTVAFGNSYNDEERCVLAGYDSGDIKMFDLRTGKIRWETSVNNGVCGIQFDRKDIKMNKCVATTLESKFHVFDLRTQHPEKGFSSLTEKVMGKVNLLASKILSTQPVACFDWSPDKEGLAVLGSFDQCIRVAVITKLHKI